MAKRKNTSVVKRALISTAKLRDLLRVLGRPTEGDKTTLMKRLAKVAGVSMSKVGTHLRIVRRHGELQVKVLQHARSFDPPRLAGESLAFAASRGFRGGPFDDDDLDDDVEDDDELDEEEELDDEDDDYEADPDDVDADDDEIDELEEETAKWARRQSAGGGVDRDRPDRQRLDALQRDVARLQKGGMSKREATRMAADFDRERVQQQKQIDSREAHQKRRAVNPFNQLGGASFLTFNPKPFGTSAHTD